jgi:hypothetical protein
MYTVYKYRSIVKLKFRGDPVHKRKGLFAAHDHEWTNNFNEMEGQQFETLSARTDENLLQSLHAVRVRKGRIDQFSAEVLTPST